MRKIVLASLALFGFTLSGFTQPAWQNNGKFDDFSELSTSYTVPFIMPDGIKLYTDIYLPIVQDCLVVPITIPIPGFNDVTRDLELIPKGTQIIMYDSINGQPNPNPFQLPMVFSRTPYKKGDGRNVEGSVISLLGYAYAVQDMRGRYTSEGVYLPLLSDSWDKNAYHPNWQHVLDKTAPTDVTNGNKHEDGYYSIQYIINSLTREFDLDFDGVTDTIDLLTNGRIGMFGASALGYNQYQAAAAHKIDPTQPGLKCLLPIVAPGDFYKSTGFGNGVLRDRLVTGWLKGQIFTGTEDERIPEDEAIAVQTDEATATQNDIHSSFDYDLPKTVTFNGVPRTYLQNKFDAANLAIDHFVSMRYPDAQSGQLGTCGYYPNSIGRTEMDISRAMVDANGEGDKNGMYSRYSNMEVPAYHLSGWWDIFVDGQIETWAQMREHLDPAKGNKFKQKLVVGPWAHQTMGQVTTGDRTYPDNVTGILGINFEDFDNQDNIPVAKALKSEIISWFRYNLNYQPDQYIGEPKAVIPESKKYTAFSEGVVDIKVRLPAEDLVLKFEELIGLLNGTGGVGNVKIETVVGSPFLGYDTSTVTIDIPAFGDPLVDGLDNNSVTSIPYRDFGNPADVPDVRVYIVGPNDDNLSQNAHKGNYWLASDTFPLPENTGNITRTNFYLHKNGKVNHTPPTEDEGYKIYVHDPNDPIYCVGGANMIVRTPDGERNSQGQFNLKDPLYAPYTIDRPGVIQFETDPVVDSLCVVGFPKATLYAKTNPGGVLTGPTDTDFFVRIIDVYPDGREYFVVEGCVNARARDYARAVCDNPAGERYPFENDDIPFTNIDIGKIYEYKFNMLPMGYTFGDGHKMKVLISSSLYTRWQVNPNLPIHDGEFFRRKPGDGRTYVYNGVEMSPRVATQRVAFAPEYPTHIDLPVYTGTYVAVEEPSTTNGPQISVYPNPATTELNIGVTEKSNYEVSVFDITGKVALNPTSFMGNKLTLNVESLSGGTYLVQVRDLINDIKSTKQITVE